jgi:hypothetical protein
MRVERKRITWKRQELIALLLQVTGQLEFPIDLVGMRVRLVGVLVELGGEEKEIQSVRFLERFEQGIEGEILVVERRKALCDSLSILLLPTM